MRVRAIAVGFYGGGLREPNTSTAVFDVPDGMTAPWWIPVDEPLPEPPKDTELTTFSGMAKKNGKESAKHAARLVGERPSDKEAI